MADIINTAIPDINTSWENYSGERNKWKMIDYLS